MLTRSIVSAALATMSCLFSANAAAAYGRELPGDIASLAIISALRLGFNQTSLGERPNSNRYAFPSGHTGFVVAQAAFLEDRYGWKYGLPAYAVAGYVAWLRVDTGHHKWRDVAAGAVVSFAVSKYFVTRYEKAPEVLPVITPGFLGLRWEHAF